MSIWSRLLSSFHFYRNLHSILDDSMKTNELMTLSDYWEFQYTHLAQHSSEKGISSEPYVKGKQVIVSLTSHGNRILDSFLAIESIMQGTVKPNRIILWLPEDKEAHSCFLENQQRRGLEIRYVKDMGPHTKLIPALKAFPEDIVITIDDDMFYRPDMVEHLLQAYKKDSSTIQAYRVAIITKDNQENIESYLKWKQYTHPEKTTNRNVIIGCEGCLYPPHSLSEEVFNEDVFRVLCPTADDIWFTAMAMMNSTSISHVESRFGNGCAGGIMNLRMQSSGLVHQNEDPRDCRNDIQFRAVFDKYNLYPLIG